MEKITLLKRNGKLEPIDNSYRVLGVVEYPKIGPVMTRASGIFSTIRFNVSKIVGERTETDGERMIYELESLPSSVQEEIFSKFYLPR